MNVLSATRPAVPSKPILFKTIVRKLGLTAAQEQKLWLDMYQGRVFSTKDAKFRYLVQEPTIRTWLALQERQAPVPASTTYGDWTIQNTTTGVWFYRTAWASSYGKATTTVADAKSEIDAIEARAEAHFAARLAAQ